MGLILALAFIALLYYGNPDTNDRWWYCFAAGLVVLTQLGLWHPKSFGLFLAIVAFKFVKDIFKAP